MPCGPVPLGGTAPSVKNLVYNSWSRRISGLHLRARTGPSDRLSFPGTFEGGRPSHREPWAGKCRSGAMGGKMPLRGEKGQKVPKSVPPERAGRLRYIRFLNSCSKMFFLKSWNLFVTNPKKIPRSKGEKRQYWLTVHGQGSIINVTFGQESLCGRFWKCVSGKSLNGRSSCFSACCPEPVFPRFAAPPFPQGSVCPPRRLPVREGLCPPFTQ